jgi:hypothetical protein
MINPGLLVCGDCHAVVNRTCGTPLWRIDGLGIGWGMCYHRGVW